MTLKPPEGANSPLLEFEPIIATDYGVYGNGSTDDTLALQTAISAAAGLSRELLIPAGTYKLTAGLTLASGTRLRGEGGLTVLDFSGVVADFTAMTATGTLGTPQTLTGNATAGDTTVLAPTTGFTDGGYARVQSNALTGSTSIPAGEIVRINSASSMSLYDPLSDSYATTDIAKATPISPVSKLVIEGLRFRGPTDNTLSVGGIDLEFCENVEVRNCVFERTHYFAVNIVDSVFCRVVGCHFQDITKTGLAYGVVFGNASQDCTVAGCTGARLRHLVSHGGSTGRFGVPRRTTTVACVASQLMDAGFDCHPGAEDITVAGCTFLGCEQDGISFQASSGVIANNVIRDVTRHGILVQHLSNRGLDVVVSGNQVRKAGSIGINVSPNASFALFRNVSIIGNTVDTTVGAGINVGSSVAALSHVAVVGNSVRAPGSHAILADSINYGAINANTVEITAASITGIYCRAYVDGVVSGNTVHSGSATSTNGIRVGTNASSVISSGVAVTGNRVTGPATGINIESTTTNTTLTGNNTLGSTAGFFLGTGAGNVAADNLPGLMATVASASTVTLPASENGIVKVSGTTTIDTITATNMTGRRVTLITTATAGLSDGVGNLKLASAFTGSADDAVTLACDGTNWFELARSVN